MMNISLMHAGTPLLATAFSWIDGLILVGYLLGLAALGYIFSLKKIKSSKAYFLADNNMPLWAVGISLLATAQSAATFLGAPGDAYKGNLAFLSTNIGNILGIVLVAVLFIPVYYRLKVRTVYELLEYRYDAASRTAGSVIFLLGRTLASGARLMGASLAMAMIISGSTSPHLDWIAAAAFLIGVVGTLYTLYGGIRSVIYTDVIQTVVYLGAAVVAIIYLLSMLTVPSSELIDALQNTDKGTKFQLWDNSKNWYDFSNNYSPIALLIGWTLFPLGVYATDQDLAQRMLTCKNALSGSLSALVSIGVGLPVTFLFLTVGLLLYIFYKEPTLMGQQSIRSPSDIQVFLDFILYHMPVGMRGLMIAGLMAAGLSSFNSAINAMSSSLVQDILRFQPDQEQQDEAEARKQLMLSRLVSAGFGLVLIASAILCAVMYKYGDNTFLIFALLVLVFAYGPLLGVYLVALQPSRGNCYSVIAAMVIGFLFVLYMQGFIQKLLPEFLQLATYIPESMGGGKISLPWQMTFSVLISAMICIIGPRRSRQRQRLTMSQLHLIPTPKTVEFLNDRIHIPQDKILVDGAHQHIIDVTLGPNAFRFEKSPTDKPFIACYYDHQYSDNPHAYKIVIREPSHPGRCPVELTAVTQHGQRYGLITLRQIIRQCGRHLPGMIIEDAPDFIHRGVMLDISRDRVPNMEHLKHMISQLAELKLTHLQLYTEHAFAYEGHETVWEKASPITPAELKEIDALCQTYGIELAANQNCLGHMTRWLKHDSYADLAETQGEWFFKEHRREGPWSLRPSDPKSLALIKDMLSQQQACLSSHLMNVNCDECYDLGAGYSKDRVAEEGKAQVYLDHLLDVHDIVTGLGCRMMYWADMALDDPEMLPELPKNSIALAWDYEADSNFRSWTTLLTEAGLETWVCPGTSAWLSLAGRTATRDQNLRLAAAEHRRDQVTGFLITNWGDQGHWQQWPVELIGIAEGAALAWYADATPSSRASSYHLFKDQSLQLVDWVRSLGNLDRSLNEIAGPKDRHGQPTQLRNASVLFKELRRSTDEPVICGTEEDWHSLQQQLVQLQASAPLQQVSSLVRDELRHTLNLMELAVERALLTLGSPHAKWDPLALTAQAQTMIESHRRLWLKRSRPGGLADSQQGFEALLQEGKLPS